MPAAAPGLTDRLDGVVDRDEYLRVVAESLADLLGADFVGRVALDLGSRSARVERHPRGGRPAGDLARQLLDLADGHPVVRSYRADRSRGLPAPRRLSDVATRAELLRSPAYVEMLRPGGAEHQMTIMTARRAAGGSRVWTVNRRGADFTDAELASARAVQPVLALLDRTVGAATAAPGGAAADGRPALTAREVEVLGHVGAGLTSDAVARLLGISDRTVRKHLENAYRKLDRHDRLLAVDRARELGVLPEPRRRTG